MFINRVFVIIIYFGLLITHGCQKTEEKEVISENRIISLAPHTTEIIYALGAQKHLLAVTDYCLYPKEASTKVKIGGFLNPNIERIVSLHPTHLFGLPSHNKLSQDLKKYKLTITMLPNENIADVLHTINAIGKMIGHADQANRLVNRIKSTLDSLKMSNINRSTRAILMIGREKGTLRNITAAGKDTYIDELWDLVGGVNSYSDLPTRYGTINLESLLLRDPDVIIEFDMKGERGVSRTEINKEWNYLENLRAVKNKNIFVIGGNHTMIPGPRLLMLAEDFNKIIRTVTDN